ncbi:hypothetical protein MKX03_001161 [Papaver bracteatum]|nr:hypothetical protein MKX03_001161 [Papaver bracteatum]
MDVVDDWRTHLSASSRERILGKILETLKRVAPHRPEEFHAVESIARRFEGNVYNSATSQSDYLRRISLKMLTASSRSFRVNSSTTATATTTASSASTSATAIATAATAATNTTTTDSNESRVTRSGKTSHQLSTYFIHSLNKEFITLYPKKRSKIEILTASNDLHVYLIEVTPLS